MDHKKIAPGLRVVMEEYKQKGREGLFRYKNAMGLVTVERPKTPRVVVFLRCKEDASFENLIPENIQVNQSTGKVRTAFLPVESLDPLSEDPNIHQILPSHYLKPLMDVAKIKANVREFRNTTRLGGEGVIIGIVDSGVDARHPAFTGRILRIWDQVLHGNGVLEGSYGMELEGEMMILSRDEHGHGTHVAGIAAGEDELYGGVAPKSDLLIVKTDMMNTHIADGIRYIFRVADEMQRPAVINLSLGAHSDAHDGTDPLSQIIDAESGPGHLVCCAAGNEGEVNIHARPKMETGFDTLRVYVPQLRGTEPIRTVFLNGWYKGNNPLEVSVSSPERNATPYFPVAESNPGINHELPEGTVSVYPSGPDPENGDYNFFVVISNYQEQPVTEGLWRLRLRGDLGGEDRIDVWVIDDTQMYAAQFASKWNIMDDMKIGSPGAAGNAVTVASYTTKNEWTDIDGNVMQRDLLLDSISEFSSEGPLRNYSKKPDFATPGAWIVSAHSSDASWIPSCYLCADGFCIMQGTSMATPFMTGIVSLLLERKPDLSPGRVKELLKAQCSIPGKNPGEFDRKWGYGFSKLES